MLTTDQALILLPQDTIFLPADAGMYVRRGGTALKVKGANAHSNFLSMVPRLDGTRTLNQICEDLDPNERETVKRLIASLLDRRVLLPLSKADRFLLTAAEHEEFSAPIGLLSHLVEHPVTSFLRFRNAHVFLAGDLAATVVTARALWRNGLKRIALLGTNAAAQEAIAVASRRESREANQIEAAFFNALPRRRNEGELVCYASTHPDLRHLYALAEQCARSKRTFLAAVIVDGRARIGPISSFTQAGCWNCGFLRFVEQAEKGVAAELWRDRVLGPPPIDPLQHESLPIFEIMGHATAFRMFRFLCGVQFDPDERLAIESTSCDTLETAISKVMPHPECRLCRGLPMPERANLAGGQAASSLPEELLVDASYGIFNSFDDDSLAQVPVFQSSLRLDQCNGASTAAVPGNSLVSNADARRQALLAACASYSTRRGAPLAQPADTIENLRARGITPLLPCDLLGQFDSPCDEHPTNEWIRCHALDRGGAFAVPRAAFLGARWPLRPDSAPPAVACSFSSSAAGRVAVRELITREGLKAVANGRIVPKKLREGGLPLELATYLAIARASFPLLQIWLLRLRGVWISLVALDDSPTDMHRLFVGSADVERDAVAAAMVEAMAVAMGGGASVRAWNDLLPPFLGYGAFPRPSDAQPDATTFESSFLDDPGPSACDVLSVVCDISKPDLTHAGIFSAAALFARPDRRFVDNARHDAP